MNTPVQTTPTQQNNVQQTQQPTQTQQTAAPVKEWPKAFKLKGGKHRFTDPKTGKKVTATAGDTVYVSEGQFAVLKDKLEPLNS